MATFLFNEIIFGPVQSRRLGVSLGINLLPTQSKLCSFDCIYCECGWNPDPKKVKAELPSRQTVKLALEKKLNEMMSENNCPDVITFAGNGEPTLHPEFADIINDTIELRNSITPNARIAVLSNSTMLFKKPVVEALKKIEDNILKLDSAFPQTVEIMDQPVGNFDIDKLVEQLCTFNGQLIIQTMFLKGSHKNINFDNTTQVEVEAWIKLLERIKPERVMIYTIARDTPAKKLEKISLETLEKIATQVRQKTGLKVEVSA